MSRRSSPHDAMAAAAARLARLAADPSPGAAGRQTFTIHQDAPVLAHVGMDGEGLAHGDMLAFEARIDIGGGDAGLLRGILITVDLPDTDGKLHQDRIGQLYFDLGGGNTLVVAGGSVYPRRGIEMAHGNEQVRAVIGGTGAFIGARGEVATVRHEGGGYDHHFLLLD